jgi:hypothetical protein
MAERRGDREEAHQANVCGAVMRRAAWEFLHPAVTRAHLGYLPDWLNLDDARSARDQIDAGYVYGGFREMHGFTLGADNSLWFPGDPPLKPIACAHFRQELVLLYQSDWVAIVQKDRSFVVARID